MTHAQIRMDCIPSWNDFQILFFIESYYDEGWSCTEQKVWTNSFLGLTFLVCTSWWVHSYMQLDTLNFFPLFFLLSISKSHTVTAAVFWAIWFRDAQCLHLCKRSISHASENFCYPTHLWDLVGILVFLSIILGCLKTIHIKTWQCILLIRLGL